MTYFRSVAINENKGLTHNKASGFFTNKSLNKCIDDLKGIKNYTKLSDSPNIENKKITFENLKEADNYKKREMNSKGFKFGSPIGNFLQDKLKDSTKLIKNDSSEPNIENEIQINTNLIKKTSAPMKLNAKIYKKVQNKLCTSNDNLNSSFTKEITVPEIVLQFAENNSEFYPKNLEKPAVSHRKVHSFSNINDSNFRDSSYSSNVLYFNPSVLEQNNIDPKEVDFICKKVFDKRYRYLINPKKPKKINKRDLENSNYKIENELKKLKDAKPPSYIDHKIKEIKTKLFFMKGIVDYSYPQIIVKKFQSVNKILNKQKIKKEIEYMNKTRDLNFNRDKSNSRINLLSDSLSVNNFFNDDNFHITQRHIRKSSCEMNEKQSNQFRKSSSMFRNLSQSRMSSPVLESTRKSSLVKVYNPLIINSYRKEVE